MTKDKMILLQIKGDRFCDIEPEHEIPDESEIQVLLLKRLHTSSWKYLSTEKYFHEEMSKRL